jgi:peptide deformylase
MIMFATMESMDIGIASVQINNDKVCTSLPSQPVEDACESLKNVNPHHASSTR